METKLQKAEKEAKEWLACSHEQVIQTGLLRASGGATSMFHWTGPQHDYVECNYDCLYNCWDITISLTSDV